MEIKLSNCDISKIQDECNLPHWENRKLTYVCFDNDTPVGFVSADYVLDECTIFDIGCLPNYRRKGIAYGLLNTLINKCKQENFLTVTLEVRSENIPAIKLYEKCGFECVGKRKYYYKNPKDDALIYTLILR